MVDAITPFSLTENNLLVSDLCLLNGQQALLGRYQEFDGYTMTLASRLRE